MERLCFSEILVSAYESTWRHNPEEQHRESFCPVSSERVIMELVVVSDLLSKAAKEEGL